MNIDYTKPFRFTSNAVEYTYNPPKQQHSGECKITWDDGYTFYLLSTIKCYIEEEIEAAKKKAVESCWQDIL